ncbi:MAG: ABC transporter permease [Candidatus Bipolaricaulota bacterium]|nr:MAG: ABC transporter permease [Candidatus Bipolaricaulota bacterium]
MQFRLALRNVFRNRRRTLFSLSVLVVSITILFVVLAFQSQFLLSVRASLACETGAVQVADERLFENTADGYDYLIAPAQRQQVIDLATALDPEAGVTWRLDFAGLVGDEQGSTLLIGRGIVTETAARPYACVDVHGTRLSAGDAREVLLGSALARRLGVSAGDRINIATGTVSGNFNAATVSVLGEVGASVEELESQLGLFPIAFVQRLLKTDGVERIVIQLDDLDNAPRFSEELGIALEDVNLPLTTRTWEELNGSYESIRSFYAAFSGLAAVAIFVFIFFSVLEVLTISFLERTREIGTIRAFGVTRGRVLRSFLLEGLVLGLVGAPVGVVAGALLVIVFNAVGVQWTPPGAALPQALRLSIDTGVVLVPLMLAITATLVGSWFPSLRISRTTVVDALRSGA